MTFTIKEVKELLKYLLKLKIPVLLNGPTGVGKTSILQEIAKEERYNFIDIRLARELPEGIGGIPHKDEKEKVFVKYLHKRLKKALEERSIVFFDEYNRSHAWQRNAVMSIFYERRLEDIELHDESTVVLAVNLGEGYQTEEVDTAVIARCAVLNVDYDLDSWIEFARTYYPDAFDIIAEKIEDIFQKIPSYNFTTLNPARSTRNLEFALQVIDYSLRNNLDREITKRLLSTIVPSDILSLINLEVDFQLIKDIIAGKWREDEKILKKSEKDIIGILNILKYRKYENLEQISNVIEFVYSFYNEKHLKDQFVIFLMILKQYNPEFFIEYISNLPEDSEILEVIENVTEEIVKTL